MYSVAFSKHNNQTYGFDQPDHMAPAGNYATVSIAGNNTRIPWKSLASGHIDKLKAYITGMPYDSVYFSRNSAQMVMKAPGNAENERQLLATGDDNEEDQLYAWYTYTGKSTTHDSTKSTQPKYYLAGAVNLASYQNQQVSLCLVSVNGSAVPEASYIQQELNKIYAPAITSWNVSTLEGGLTVSLSNTDQHVLDNTDQNDHMNLTAEEKQVVKAMKKHTAYNSDTYYLFFFTSGKDNSQNGYMPFKSHFGFIFKNNQNVDEQMRTIAHELGHGPFHLRHTFSPGNKFVQTQGATSNLMDYVSADKALTARNFYKYQWDYIHDPESM